MKCWLLDSCFFHFCCLFTERPDIAQVISLKWRYNSLEFTTKYRFNVTALETLNKDCRFDGQTQDLIKVLPLIPDWILVFSMYYCLVGL